MNNHKNPNKKTEQFRPNFSNPFLADQANSPFSRRYRNYLDNSCKHITVPIPGPIQLNNSIMHMLLGFGSQTDPEPKLANKSISQLNTNASQGHVEFMGKNVSSEIFHQDEDQSEKQIHQHDPIISVNLQDINRVAHIQDMQRVIMLERECQIKQKKGKFAAHVQFSGNDQIPCLHNVFFSLKNPNNGSIEFQKLEDDSIHIKLVPKEVHNNFLEDNESLEMKNFTLKSSDIISKFFNYLKLYTKGLINKRYLKINLFQNNEVKINYKKIKLFLLKFFQIEEFNNELKSLNKFEMIFVGIILNKKKYLKWKDKEINFLNLQTSPCKLKKPKLYKFFLNFFVKYLIRKHNGKSKGICFQKQSENFFNFIFGPNQIPELKNEKNFTQTLKSLKSFIISFLPDEPKDINFTEEELLKKFTKILVSLGRFKSFISSRFLDKTTKMMFEDYKTHKMKKTIEKIVNYFENKLENYDDKVDGLLEYYVTLKTNSKFNGIWTFKEFQQGKEVFLEYACY